MHKHISWLGLTAAFLLTLALPAAADSAAPMASPAASMGSMGTMAPKMKCPAGKKWVKGYTKKNGMKVKGYCR
jgi:hypothetical protein